MVATMYGRTLTCATKPSRNLMGMNRRHSSAGFTKFRSPVSILIFICAFHSSVQSCCDNKDCSFSSPTQGHVACELKDHTAEELGCDTSNYRASNNDEAPGPVKDLSASFYYTQCNPKINSEYGETRCNTNCNKTNGKAYVAINITFKLEPNSVNKLTAVEIQLFGHTDVKINLCVLYDYGKGNLTHDDAENHVFHYDGFSGLIARHSYDVRVRTLPEAAATTWTNKIITVPTLPCDSEFPEVCYRTCPEKVPDPYVTLHPTPFAINFTLNVPGQESRFNTTRRYIIDVAKSEYNFNYTFDNHTYTTPFIVDCMEPAAYLIRIYSQEPGETVLLVERLVPVQGGKPVITGCPSNISEKIGNNGTSWPTPSAKSVRPECNGLARVSSNQTHHVGQVFPEGTITEVRYEFWQYEQDGTATCTFYVHVIREPTTPPLPTTGPRQLDLDKVLTALEPVKTWRIVGGVSAVFVLILVAGCVIIYRNIKYHGQSRLDSHIGTTKQSVGTTNFHQQDEGVQFSLPGPKDGIGLGYLANAPSEVSSIQGADNKEWYTTNWLRGAPLDSGCGTIELSDERKED